MRLHNFLFILATIIFPWVNDSLWKTVSLHLPEGKMWSEYQNATGTCRDVGLLFVVDSSTLRWNRGWFKIADPQAYTPGIFGCRHWHAPSSSHFIVDVLTGIYSVESGGEFICSLSQSTTSMEQTEVNQSGDGLWRMTMPGRSLSPYLYRKWGTVVRLRDLHRPGLDCRILCLLAVRPWASCLVALCLSFPYVKLGKDTHLIELWSGCVKSVYVPTLV